MGTTKNTIPKGWTAVTLDKLLVEVGTRNREHEDLPVLSVTNTRGFVLQSDQFARKLHSASTKNYKIVSKGEFGYNPARINVGSISSLETHERGLLSPMYVVFKTLGNLDTDYFNQYVQTPEFNRQVKNNTAGSVRQSLNFSAFKNFRFLLPPLNEQRKISEILQAVDQEIRITDAIISATAKLKSALVGHLLTRGTGNTGYKRSKIGEIPEDWEVKSFSDVIKVANGQVDPKEEPFRSMILIAPNHIESGSGRILEKVTAEGQEAISGKYLVEKGEIIYSKIRPYLRKVTIAEESCLCSADMYPIKGVNGLSNEFLYHILLSDNFTNFANANSGRTGMPKINREELHKYTFALPPIEEQLKIDEILVSFDKKIFVNQAIRKNISHLREGLMHDLLTGQKRTI